MVGYEPDLNPKIDCNEEFRAFQMGISLPKPCHTRPVVDNPSLSKPSISEDDDDDDDEGYVARSATPLIQVFAVRVFTYFDNGKSCEIYGSIRTLEGPHPRFVLYDRDPEDSETICEQGDLSLIGPEGGAILPSMSTALELCLKDRIQGVEVVRGMLDFDAASEDSYDRLLKGVVHGSHGFAHVYYVVFQFALCGTVHVTVTKNDCDDKNCNATDIYGSIVAGYANGRQYCSDDHDVEYLQTRLFEKPPRQALRVMLGTPIKLSRSVVAVPSYSTLTVRANLWDSTGTIASDCLEFPAYVLGQNHKYIRTQHACVTVNVRWRHAYLLLYTDRILEDSHVASSLKKPRVSHGQQFSAFLIPRTVLAIHFGGQKVDVFTVFIGGINEKISALFGTILIDDGIDIFSIYNRDESCSELLPDNSLACIELNYRAIQNNYFYIISNLRDPVSKLEVSRGTISWNMGSLHANKLYNKHLCSVIRGKDGYAAVHYEVFENAFHAFVVVKLFADGHPDIPINLYGTLSARSSSHNYSTSYQRKYFMSRLFDQPRDRSLELKAGSEIALLKSIVIVPARSSLIIEANLGALGIGSVDEGVAGIAEFEIDLSGTLTKEIRGEHYWIEVYVNFKS